MVGTFHASSKKQRAIYAVGPILEPVIEKLAVRIAVSEAARHTLTQHLETDAIVIPNGIFTDKFAAGASRPEWTGNTLGFMGRFEEPRKGLSVLLDALPIVTRFVPDVRVLVAGPGDGDDFLKKVDPQLRGRITFLGRLNEKDKADFLSSVSLYVAPNTGGESFGIILAEAMAAGASIVASDIPAFSSLLGQGKYGALFKSEDSTDLARILIDLLRDEEKRKAVAAVGREHSKVFDWRNVAQQILSVYEMATVGGSGVRLASDTRSWSRLLNREMGPE